jgi:murein DD-endopeptidase MepM/ murein hydrolase activator NlpD
MVPARTNRNGCRAGTAALLLLPVLLAGCESTPPKTSDYWPEPTYLTVVVHKGDTLSQIAARYDVSLATLEQMNDVSARDAIHPGETLRVPAKSQATRAAVLREAVAPRYAAWNAPSAGSVTVRALRAPAPHRAKSAPAVVPQPAPKAAVLADAAAPKADADSEAPAKTASSLGAACEFEWPVEGKIIAAFGKTGDGERNDGINIAADLGTPIHAAAAGTVTYAGNELKGYGNLILIKHDDGYVTAYAHAERITVARGDRVDRGDVIGFAGATGDVTSPQLHFEIRQGVKPVDPRPLLLASRES